MDIPIKLNLLGATRFTVAIPPKESDDPISENIKEIGLPNNSADMKIFTMDIIPASANENSKSTIVMIMFDIPKRNPGNGITRLIGISDSRYENSNATVESIPHRVIRMVVLLSRDLIDIFITPYYGDRDSSRRADNGLRCMSDFATGYTYFVFAIGMTDIYTIFCDYNS